MSDSLGVEARLDALNDVTQRLMHAETEQEICDVAVDGVPEIFDVQYGALWLYDADANELQVTALTEQAEAELGSDVVYRPGNSLSWEAFQSGERRFFQQEDTPSNTYSEDPTLASELILPLGDYGVLNVGAETPTAFPPAAQQVGEVLATSVESALNKAEREHALKVKNDRLEEFVGIVSHDLRNPLAVADGNLELARAQCDSEKLPKVADAIDRMDTLIDDLLTLAEQGYVVEDRTQISLETIAERAWSNVQTPTAKLTVTGSVSVFGDEGRLLQLFENLFRNAVEHAGEDVTVRVGPLETVPTATRTSAADSTDGFFVADDGPGIPDSEKADVFDSGHSTDGEGTGLGLAIVERIVSAHGWNIVVKDDLHGGARFEIVAGTKSVSPFDAG